MVYGPLYLAAEQLEDGVKRLGLWDLYGGYLPSHSARSDHGCLTFPDRCRTTSLKKRPTEYLRKLYFIT